MASCLACLSCRPCLAGIFIGGRAVRMGGIAKGLLVTERGEPIVVRTRRILEQCGASCVLVGHHPAYAGVGLESLADDPGAEGPLAGLLALLGRAEAEGKAALAVACDMPSITAGAVRALLDAPGAPIVAPRRTDEARGRDLWEPLFARYEPALVLPIARAFAQRGGRRLQQLLDDAGAMPLVLADEAALTDWDAPGDLPGTAARETRDP